MKKQNEIIIYQTDDGQTKVQVLLDDDAVWLNQDQMAELFQKSKSTINEHIKSIYREKELTEELSMRKFGISELSTKPTNFYNLDVIIAVGYRVKSVRGAQFRIWATQRLKEYIVKGFTLDDERLKQDGQKARYFQELLQRIRDIRSYERDFYQKVTDIYATSVDGIGKLRAIIYGKIIHFPIAYSDVSPTRGEKSHHICLLFSRNVMQELATRVISTLHFILKSDVQIVDYSSKGETDGK